MKKALYTITIILLVLVFLFSGYQVVNYFIDGKNQAERFDDLAAIKNNVRDSATTPTKAPESAEDPTASTEETEPVMLPEYAELYAMNDDLVGWITIEGTKIDYPVMQTPTETNYYLKRNFDKTDSARGCIYAREECDILEPSDNVTLYGHTMLDGSMFAGLHAYTEKDAWEENSLIFFDTLYEYHVYQIFAVFKTTASLGEGFTYHQFVDAQTEEEFNEFVKTCKDLAFYETGITPVYGDKLICLSTCEYTQTNGRLVVAAVRIS